MSRFIKFRNLFIGGLLSTALVVSPAQAHHDHGADIVVPLAALFAFGALYHHGHHRHRSHRHYYRSYKRHGYGHGHGHSHGHGHAYKRRSYSHGGYHGRKH